MAITKLEQLRAEQRKRWEPVWRTCKLDRAMTLDAFVSAPWHHLAGNGQEAYFRSTKAGFRPLLPQQAKIAKRIRAMEMAKDRRYGNIVPVHFG